MKNIWIILLLLFLTSSIKNQKQITNFVIDEYNQCAINCKMRGLRCFGIIERTVYDGKTELSKVLKKEVFGICSLYSERTRYPNET